MAAERILGVRHPDRMAAERISGARHPDGMAAEKIFGCETSGEGRTLL